MSKFAPLLVSALLATAAAPAMAQPFAPPPGPPYPLPAEKSQDVLYKEFGGMWVMNNRISIEKYETIAQPLQPKYQAMKEKLIADRAAGRQVFTSDAQCIPQGMPRQMDGNFEVHRAADEPGPVHRRLVNAGAQHLAGRQKAHRLRTTCSRASPASRSATGKATPWWSTPSA